MGERTAKFTTSMVKCFKQCRKRYQLEYVDNLKPIQTPKALELGTLYHSGLEYLLNGMELINIPGQLEADQRNRCMDAGVDYDPIPVGIATEMVTAFYLESGYQEWDIQSVEKTFEVSIGYGKRLIGKIDSIMMKNNSDFLIEHKTTSCWATDGAEYLHNLLWDEQSTNYLYAYKELFGKYAKGVIYCIVEKPTIKPLLATPIEKRRYKQTGEIYSNQRENDETPEEYLTRVCAWYREKPRVHIHFIYRTPDEIERQVNDLKLVFKDISECEKNETFYRNPSACSILECPYRPKCLENNPESDCLFTTKIARNEEL